MNQRQAFLVSLIFHPVFINVGGLLLLALMFPYLFTSLPQKAKIWLGGIYLLNTVVLPVFLTMTMFYSGKVSTIMLQAKEERKGPYFITSVLCLVTYYLFKNVNLDSYILNYILGCTTILIAVSVINNFYKISAHAAACGGITGLLISSVPYAETDVRIILGVWILLSGLVLSARLFAKSHDPLQIISGFILGLIVMMLLF